MGNYVKEAFKKLQSLDGAGSSGHYWSASYLDSYSAWCVNFNDASFRIVNGIRNLGQGVRLVQDYQP